MRQVAGGGARGLRRHDGARFATPSRPIGQPRRLRGSRSATRYSPSVSEYNRRRGRSVLSALPPGLAKRRAA